MKEVKLNILAAQKIITVNDTIGHPTPKKDKKRRRDSEESENTEFSEDNEIKKPNPKKTNQKAPKKKTAKKTTAKTPKRGRKPLNPTHEGAQETVDKTIKESHVSTNSQVSQPLDVGSPKIEEKEEHPQIQEALMQLIISNRQTQSLIKHLIENTISRENQNKTGRG